MEHQEHTQLTSAEIAELWSIYMNDSAMACVLTHFAETVEDEEVRPRMQQALMIAKQNMEDVERIFEQEEILPPHAFPIKQHVVKGTPRLFSDVFYLTFVLHGSRTAMATHAAAITMAARKDLSDMFRVFFDRAYELHISVRDVMQAKGVYVRSPQITYPRQLDYVQKTSFMGGYFGKKRPLLAVEVAHLYMTGLNNEIGRSICIGFAQVNKDPQLQQYYARGVQFTKGIVEHVHEALMDSDVIYPTTWDVNVTDSTISPFSDSLMLYVVTGLAGLGITVYGAALSTSMRRDLGSMYASFINKAAHFAEDGLELLINRGWMEQPPRVNDRKKLMGQD
ncbi:DUF3231 family protein [Ectobacillus ponti]|uniref:DUF3231 family protein n=1 Tax=Ectobacillus ponti TaxID=2961894 RepID=A0AA41X725_9BACI|nr:DUF3231 family protein [Ectobacillus ponti]MCP8967515.1 DUF3231 family protein [Ectobacillus ponti]